MKSEQNKIKVETRRIKDLIPAYYNPRKDLKPGDEEYEKIRSSIEGFGYVDPIIINRDGTIIGGHQRWKIMRDLGYDEIDCVVVDLDKDREKALNLALNKISGKWDEMMLDELLRDLDLELVMLAGFDLPDEDLAVVQDDEEPEVEFTEELLEENNYLVLKCDNSVDWLQVETFFDLKPVKDLDSKVGFEKKGIGRVIDATEFFRKLLGGDE